MNPQNDSQPNFLFKIGQEILTGAITTTILLNGLASLGPVLVVSIVCTLGVALVVWLPVLWLLGKLTRAIFRHFCISERQAPAPQNFGAVVKTIVLGCLGLTSLTLPFGVFSLPFAILLTPTIEGWLAWPLGLWLVGRLTPAILQWLDINFSNFALGGSRSQAEEGDAITTIKPLTPQQKSLTNYIRKAQAKGFSENQIQSRLSQQGWSNTEITQAQAMVNAG